MKFYNEQEAIEAIEKNWGEIEQYSWNGDSGVVSVRFTEGAAEQIAARVNSAKFNIGIPKLTAEDVREKDFSADGLAQELGNMAHGFRGGYGAAEFVEGGIMIFDDYDEFRTWKNQK